MQQSAFSLLAVLRCGGNGCRGMAHTHAVDRNTTNPAQVMWPGGRWRVLALTVCEEFSEELVALKMKKINIKKGKTKKNC
jgi:hypothetical protein